MSFLSALQVSPSQGGAALTSAQKRFNTLLRQIERTRQTLRAWRDGVPAYRQAHAELLQPLSNQLLDVHRQWIFALADALEKRKWTPTQRSTLRELVCENAGGLLEARGDDPEIKALFDQHAEVDFDTEKRTRLQEMKESAEWMTGLDLGDDDDLESPADLFQRMQERMQAREAEPSEPAEKPLLRKKTAAQSRREAEARQATQSVREVYRKLASALHPDRETDLQQRAAKTALMQRVNQAYDAKDLLALLELQLEIEQLDATHIAQASDQRVKHYNKVLAEQLKELKFELDHVEANFCIEFGLRPWGTMDPTKLGQLLEQGKREWLARLNEQQQDLRMLNDSAAMKRWLNQQRNRRRWGPFADDLF